MKTYKEVAKEIVLSYFQTLSYKDKLNVNELSEILYIQNDDKVLLQHIKAMKKPKGMTSKTWKQHLKIMEMNKGIAKKKMKNPFENAIKEMEDSD